jgi:hypothetical protein
MSINLQHALQLFNSNGIDINEDFHTLSSSKVETILDCSKYDGYRKSKTANGSTARCYFEALQKMHNRK